MTQKDKELLFKDLCARLPYHPTLNWKFIDNTSKDEELKELSDLYIWWITKAQDCEVKPYLYPMSSMTEEEREEYKYIAPGIVIEDGMRLPNINQINWLLAHHFDIRNLIEKGLALEAPEGMY